VGEKYTLEVDLYPMLLTYPDEAKVVQVNLWYRDPANDVDETGTFVFSSDRKEPQVWRVRGADGGPRQYTYEVVYMGSTGHVHRLPQVTQDAEAIIIPPYVDEPPPPPPVPPAPTPPGP
jgi:hypothetical protein